MKKLPEILSRVLMRNVAFCLKRSPVILHRMNDWSEQICQDVGLHKIQYNIRYINII